MEIAILFAVLSPFAVNEHVHFSYSQSALGHTEQTTLLCRAVLFFQEIKWH